MDTYEVVRELCATVLSVSPEEIVPEARLVADLEADSLDFAELADRLEKDHGLAVDEAALKRVDTVADLVELVELVGGTADGSAGREREQE